MFCDFHKTKDERFREQQQSSQSDKVLYIRNLKPDTTPKKLKEAFSIFGEVISTSVKQITRGEKNLRSGFIEFKTKEDAYHAILEGKTR